MMSSLADRCKLPAVKHGRARLLQAAEKCLHWDSALFQDLFFRRARFHFVCVSRRFVLGCNSHLGPHTTSRVRVIARCAADSALPPPSETSSPPAVVPGTSSAATPPRA